MRTAMWLMASAFLVVASALAAAGPAAGAAEESEDFFNGRDFDGWEGLMQYWSIRDGAIVGKAPPEGLRFNTYLCSKKKYRDFELRVQVRFRDAKGNSGVQFRGRIVDPVKYAVAGPQGNLGRPFGGGVYGEIDPGRWLKLPSQKVVQQVVKPAEFNDYYLRCVGKHVTTKINGTTIVDEVFPEVPEEGIIAWQIRADFK